MAEASERSGPVEEAMAEDGSDAGSVASAQPYGRPWPRRRRGRRCYRCEGKGHTAHVCPSRVVDDELQDIHIKCYNCGGWGHRKSVCPTPRRKPRNKGNDHGTGGGQGQSHGQNVFYIYNK
ncbi:uncharacterized protein [Porites lutea]|uniref:uncharacterized protein n=1 Tax=Porites lutea TaxID=51062 RepID=UPI003CC6ACEA